MAEQSPTTRTDEGFLPDFCTPGAALAVVVITELVAIVLALARHTADQSLWLELARLSVFLLWVGLITAAALCWARPRLNGMSAPMVTVIGLALLATVTALVTEGAWWIGQYLGERYVATAAELFPTTRGPFLLRNIAISLVVGSLALRYFYVTHQWRRNVEMEARSRVDALQARIRPHFLFNSMNTIAALTRSDPRKAEEAVEDLSDLFRASLNEASGQLPLKQELEIARIYQRIEQLRLGDRLEVKWDLGDLPMRALIPGLSLQPLIENAIYHGIEPRPDGGCVHVRGRVDPGNRAIELSVSNPLPDPPVPGRRTGNRMALENIRQRFRLAYGHRGGVEVDADSERYRVVLRFPLEEQSG